MGRLFSRASDEADSLSPDSARAMLLLLICLAFLSGTCALTYEVVWQRMLTFVFGVTTHATTVILASFMGGMAIGGWLLGRLSDRIRRPVRLFAAMELAIGVTAALFPLLVPFAMRLLVSAPDSMHGSSPVSIGLRLVLCFPLLLLPAALMGGTLPVLAQLARKRPERTGRWLGLVYGSNTLGAVAGTVLAGFVLLPALGARQTALLANGMNLLIGLLAFACCRGLDLPDRAADEAPPQPRANPALEGSWPKLVLVAALISGACALAFEVLWTRILTGFLHANIYAFPTMLATFLAGAALGSLLFAHLLDRHAGSLTLLGAIQATIGLLALTSAYQVTHLRELQPKIGEMVGAGWVADSLADFAYSGFIMFAPCLLMGLSFPLICRIYTNGKDWLGGGVGACYAANTAGGVLGAVLAGFVAIPLIGVTLSVFAVSLSSALLGGALLLASPTASWQTRGALLGSVVATFGAICIWLIPWNTPISWFTLNLRDVRSDRTLLYHNNGVAGTVTVVRSAPHYYENKRHLSIEVNGVEVAGDSPKLRATQKVQGHVPPMLFHALNGRPPATAFILGFGSGEASACSVRHVTQRLDCLELCAGEIGANVHFDEINGKVLSNPRFRLIINDARNHLLTTRERYDVIMSDSTHPAVNSDTYTLAYYRLCRERLTPGGVFSTWVPIYDMTADDLRCLLRTMLEAFGRVSIWFPPQSGKHAVFVATRQPMRLDLALLAQDLARPEIKKSLALIDVQNLEDLLTLFVADQTTIGPAVRNSPLNTDDNFLLPLRIPRNQLRGEKTLPQTLALFTTLATSIAPRLTGASAEFLSSLRKREQVRDLLLQGVAHGYSNDRSKAHTAFTQALALLDRSSIRDLLKKNRFDECYAEGVAAAEAGAYPVALQQFATALEIRPDNVLLLNFSGMCYYNLGQPQKAIAYFRRALSVLPDFSWSRFNLAQTLEAIGQDQQARVQLQQILEHHPRMREARTLLEQIEK